MYYCHKRNVCTLCKNCIAFRHFKSYFLSEYSNNKVTIAVVVSVLSITSFRSRVGARVHEWGRVRTSYHGTGRPTLPLWSSLLRPRWLLDSEDTEETQSKLHREDNKASGGHQQEDLWSHFHSALTFASHDQKNSVVVLPRRVLDVLY